MCVCVQKRCEWNHFLFDTNYPSYFPAKPGFQEALATIKKKYNGQIKIAPYVNGRIFDIGGEAWKADGAVAFTAKQVPQGYQQTNLSIYEESYGSGSSFAVMCSSTPYWPAKMTSVASQLIALGIDALYVDQVGAAVTKPCFDPTHGHSLGDGISWVEGNRALLDSISKVVGGEQGNESFLLTAIDRAQRL